MGVYGEPELTLVINFDLKSFLMIINIIYFTRVVVILLVSNG